MHTALKIFVTTIIICFTGSLVAQEVGNPRNELAGKDWILMKLIIDGEEMPFVPDSEGDLSTFTVESSSTLTGGDIVFCEGLEILDMVLEGKNEFYAGEFNVLARYDYWTCNTQENTDYLYTYLYGFWNNRDLMINHPHGSFHFEYTINQWDEFEELIITIDNGDQAYFGNAALSVGQNLYSEVSLYPNPINKKLFIDQLPEKSKMEIYDMNGKLLISQNLTTEETQMDVSSLPAGLYFYRLSNAANQFKTGKLIKK